MCVSLLSAAPYALPPAAATRRPAAPRFRGPRGNPPQHAASLLPATAMRQPTIAHGLAATREHHVTARSSTVPWPSRMPKATRALAAVHNPHSFTIAYGPAAGVAPQPAPPLALCCRWLPLPRCASSSYRHLAIAANSDLPPLVACCQRHHPRN